MASNDLTYREIARRGGMDVAQVWRVLRGRSNPSYGTLKRLAVGMGVGLDMLVTMLGIEWRVNGEH